MTEVLAEKLPVPVEYVAAEDCFGEVGPQEYLQEKFGLNSNEIVKKVKRGLLFKIPNNPYQQKYPISG